MDLDKILTVIFSGVLSAVISLLLFRYKEQEKISIETQRKRNSVLNKYREFICSAAFELQSRLYNVLAADFLYYADHKDPSYVENVRFYTAFLFGQFFGWKEILRKEMHYLNFREGVEETLLLEKLDAVENYFSSDHLVSDSSFMIFKGEQRAIGEFMMVYNDAIKSYECRSYSSFTEALKEESFQKWMKPLSQHIESSIKEYEEQGEFESERLMLIQSVLIDIIDILDPGKNRFPRYREKMIQSVEEESSGVKHASTTFKSEG